jgi:hypothetical protein
MDARPAATDQPLAGPPLDRPLLVAGLLNLAALIPAVILMAVDDRQLLGISPWVKPAKFLASVGIYLVTLAWLLPRVEVGTAARRVLRWTFIITMVGENVLISLQSWRGVPSHFNYATAFDAVVFSTMGNLIAANTIAAIALLVLFLRAPRSGLSPAVLTGIRIGLLLFLVASGVGGMMVGQGAHAVGVDDGGPGLWLVNWSTEGGDLRVAHFVGLHALQGLPLLGWVVSERRSQSAGIAAVRWAAVAWALVFAWTLQQALAGRSLL